MKYRTIVVDPPWSYDEGFTVGIATGRDHLVVPTAGIRKALPYKAMDLEVIKKLPVIKCADEQGCRVFLWTTNRYLRDSFDVLDSWGFSYAQTLVWHKANPSPFSGGIAANGAEFLLVGKIGTLPVLPKAKSSVLHLSVPKQHSRKPEAFLDLVESVSPGPYLEMFSRRARLGWDTWGDEALHGTELMSA